MRDRTLRVVVRRERPHPGAQLRFTDVDGRRFQTFATDTEPGSWPGSRPGSAPMPGWRTASAAPGHRPGPVPLPAGRHQRDLAAPGPDRLRPDRLDQTTHLHGDLAVDAPKALRYRLLHVAARITRGQRRR